MTEIEGSLLPPCGISPVGRNKSSSSWTRIISMQLSLSMLAVPNWPPPPHNARGAESGPSAMDGADRVAWTVHRGRPEGRAARCITLVGGILLPCSLARRYCCRGHLSNSRLLFHRHGDNGSGENTILIYARFAAAAVSAVLNFDSKAREGERATTTMMTAAAVTLI